MPTYDFQKKTSFLEGPLGFKRSFAKDIDLCSAENALLGTVDEFNGLIVHGILCGRCEQARELLVKAKAWMEKAIQMEETSRSHKEWSHMFQRSAYATIKWLLEGVHDQVSLDVFINENLRYFQIHPDHKDGFNLSFYAVKYLDAGAYEEYISLAAPGGIDSIKCSGTNERMMALTLAAQALFQKFPVTKVREAVERFLDKNVGVWLNNAEEKRAVEWMKVIYWDKAKSGISAFDAARKCLEHVSVINNL